MRRGELVHIKEVSAGRGPAMMRIPVPGRQPLWGRDPVQGGPLQGRHRLFGAAHQTDQRQAKESSQACRARFPWAGDGHTGIQLGLGHKDAQPQFARFVPRPGGARERDSETAFQDLQRRLCCPLLACWKQGDTEPSSAMLVRVMVLFPPWESTAQLPLICRAPSYHRNHMYRRTDREP